MGSIPLLRPRDVIKAFERLGWEIARQRGSHIIMTKPGYCHPLHPRPSFCGRGTFRSLIARAGISLEEFLDSLT